MLAKKSPPKGKPVITVKDLKGSEGQQQKNRPPKYKQSGGKKETPEKKASSNKKEDDSAGTPGFKKPSGQKAKEVKVKQFGVG